MHTVPVVGTSMQPIRLRSVDLPLPDGPAMAMKTPASTLSETSRKAQISSSPRRYFFETQSTRTKTIEIRRWLPVSEALPHFGIHAIPVVVLAEQAERRPLEHIDAEDQLPVRPEVP